MSELVKGMLEGMFIYHACCTLFFQEYRAISYIIFKCHGNSSNAVFKHVYLDLLDFYGNSSNAVFKHVYLDLLDFFSSLSEHRFKVGKKAKNIRTPKNAPD